MLEWLNSIHESALKTIFRARQATKNSSVRILLGMETFQAMWKKNVMSFVQKQLNMNTPSAFVMKNILNRNDSEFESSIKSIMSELRCCDSWLDLRNQNVTNQIHNEIDHQDLQSSKKQNKGKSGQTWLVQKIANETHSFKRLPILKN